MARKSRFNDCRRIILCWFFVKAFAKRWSTILDFFVPLRWVFSVESRWRSFSSVPRDLLFLFVSLIVPEVPTYAWLPFLRLPTFLFGIRLRVFRPPSLLPAKVVKPRRWKIRWKKVSSTDPCSFLAPIQLFSFLHIHYFLYFLLYLSLSLFLLRLFSNLWFFLSTTPVPYPIYSSTCCTQLCFVG